MTERVITYIESREFGVVNWLLAFTSILFIRFFLESISSPTNSGVIASDIFTLVHYFLFFLTLTLASAIILSSLTKNYFASLKILLFGLPLLWLAPLIDIFVSGGKGFKMLYVFDTGKKLLSDFLTFFGSDLTHGVTIGIRIVVASAILSLGYYIWRKTRKISRVFLAIFFLYLVIFIIGSLPGILFTLIHLNSPLSTNNEVVNYFSNLILRSSITHNTLHDGINSVPVTRFIELGFDKVLSQTLFILSFILGLIFFFKSTKEKFLAIIKNSRIERLTFYSLSLACGIGFAYLNKLGTQFVWVDSLGFICLFISWACLWLHAVSLNDIADLNIDKISNRNRPLVKDKLSIQEMKEVSGLWLMAGLLGAWSAGYYPLFMALVYVAASYIYSTEPLRLRRLPLVPSFLIGVACAGTVLAGFFFTSQYKDIQIFPIFLLIGIILMVTLAINFKDVKDIEGDKANNIMTIPVLFPNYGIRMVASLFALSILLIPIFLSSYFLYLFCLPGAVIGYRLIVKKPYNEKHIFTLRFFLLVAIGLTYLLVYWYGKSTGIF